MSKGNIELVKKEKANGLVLGVPRRGIFGCGVVCRKSMPRTPTYSCLNNKLFVFMYEQNK